jgi:hypothetical protein
VLYVETLAAPFTVDTMPDHTLAAFADHGRAGALPVSMEHTLVTEPDAAQLAVKAAGFMADRIRSAMAANGTFTCAVSGGQTPLAHAGRARRTRPALELGRDLPGR